MPNRRSNRGEHPWRTIIVALGLVILTERRGAAASARPETRGGDLVAHFELDEGTGSTALDSTLHANRGFLKGRASWAAGQRGRALLLDGKGSYLRVPAPGDVPGPDRGVVPGEPAPPPKSSLDVDRGPLTIAAWIKPRSISRIQAIVLRGKSGGFGMGAEGYGLWIGDKGQIVFGAANGGMLDSSRGLARDVWQHVVVVTDKEATSIYLDGVNVTPSGPAYSKSLDNRAKGVHVNPSNKDLVVGAALSLDELSHDFFYEGLIDDLRIYRAALTPEEVRAIYQR